MKPLIRSGIAQADMEAAVDYYLAEAPHMADALIDAIEKAVRHVERVPATGSPRYAHELDFPGLRHWSLNRFPYALFYVEQDRHLLLLRFVHLSRDIPATLREGDEP